MSRNAIYMRMSEMTNETEEKKNWGQKTKREKWQ